MSLRQEEIKTSSRPRLFFNQVPKALLIANILATLAYLFAIGFCLKRSNIYLFSLLTASQLFFTWQSLIFLHTIWNTNWQPRLKGPFTEPVDIFITVAGEPVDIVASTVKACLAFDYPHFRVYLLNDGFALQKPNWREVEKLAQDCGITCITRKDTKGAKAGNINNALRATDSPFVAVFDVDHEPHSDFLQKVMPCFADDRVGFVQTPQYYHNFQDNQVTAGSWEQQELFFGPICQGKNRLNSVTMCGTNMVLRRQAIDEVGGMCDTNIAEDFVTGLFIHERGWKSIYVPEILAEGLAPQDMLSYHSQQFRWARGCLEVLFWFNPIFSRKLTITQKLQYLSSASYFLSGVFVLINMLVPLLFLFFGWIPFAVSTDLLAVAFLPYLFLTLYTIQRSTGFCYTFRALSFSLSSWHIHCRALFAVLTRRKSKFSITAKTALSGNFLPLVVPHLTYFGLSAAAIVYALLRYGPTASVMNNSAWVIVNSAIFIPFVKAALPQRSPNVNTAPQLSPAS